MNMFKLLVIVFSLYSFQAILTILQAKNYAKSYSELLKKGEVMVGRYRKHFKGGCIVISLLNNQYEIVETKILKGFSVLSRFQTQQDFNGLNIFEFNRWKINITDKRIVHAFEQAIEMTKKDLDREGV